MAVRPRVTVLALCAGVAALELGIRLAVPRARLVGAVERDAYAAAVLVARMGDKTLDPAPVWDDVATFDGRPWRGGVDLVAGGFPCQPWSQAGKQAGLDDPRWLWPHLARIIADVDPRFVFVENVPRLATGGGLTVVLGDLADLGFDAEWATVAAADLGAPHLRRRLFVLAFRHGERLPCLRIPEPAGLGGASGNLADRPGRPPVADPGRRGRERIGEPRVVAGPENGLGQPAREQPRHPPRGGGAAVGDPEGVTVGPGLRPTGPGPVGRRRPDDTGSSDLADAGVGRLPRSRRAGPDAPGGRVWPPGPGDADGWAEIRRQGGPQPSVRRMADGLADRVDRLHAIGNGVVPVVAAYALCALADRAGIVDPAPG